MSSYLHQVTVISGNCTSVQLFRLKSQFGNHAISTKILKRKEIRFQKVTNIKITREKKGKSAACMLPCGSSIKKQCTFVLLFILLDFPKHLKRSSLVTHAYICEVLTLHTRDKLKIEDNFNSENLIMVLSETLHSSEHRNRSDMQL